jgi:hypothetical protein
MSIPADGPPLLFRPLPLTRNQISYYIEALQLPPTGKIVCEQLAPLDQMDARLANCMWNILGLAVDPTPDIPTYPFLRLATDGASVVQVQVWLWQICLMGTPMWAELRWHPTQGSQVNFVDLSADASTGQTQLAALDRVVKLTMYTMSRGRPLGSRSRGGMNDEAFLAQLIEIVQACWQEGQRPTEGRVVQLFPGGVAHRSVQRFVHDQLGMDWDAFIEQYRPR